MTDEAVRVSTGPSTGVQGLQEVAADIDTRYSFRYILFISILYKVHSYTHLLTDRQFNFNYWMFYLFI